MIILFESIYSIFLSLFLILSSCLILCFIYLNPILSQSEKITLKEAVKNMASSMGIITSILLFVVKFLQSVFEIDTEGSDYVSPDNHP